MMDETTWKQLEDLFARAAALDGEQRIHFLDRECADQPELRRHLDELLAADQKGIKTWPGLSFGESGDTQGEADATRSDLPQISGYQCTRRLGEGGMGIVYLALRRDEVFDGRAFAVKVLHSHRAGELAKKRFADERRLLAALDHPGIVRLYDGGELVDGRPYLVMDHVEGLSLTRYCDTNKQSVRQRLTLFREVCIALHHAHQNLVVHRDLKPSNILVDSEGVPRLLDFGIAKRLPRDAEDRATTGMVPMTPAYASPEQIAGRSVTTASDLYSLGVILHELLVGGLPDPGEDAPRPSRYLATLTNAEGISEARGTSVTRLRRRIESDLDHIVAKLLRSEPEARYASARELAEDIDRHLDDLPILARRGSWRYVTGRFLRRRRVGLLAAGASVLVLILAVAAWVQSSRLRRSEAATEQLMAILVLQDHHGRVVRDLAGPAHGPFWTLSELDEITSAIFDLKVSDEDKGFMIDTVQRLHAPEDQAFERTLQLFRLASEEETYSDQDLAEVAYSIGRLFFQGDRLLEAEETIRLAVKMAQHAYGDEDPALAPFFTFHGRVLAELERYDEGVAVLRRSVTLQVDDSSMASTLSELAGLLFLKGSFEESAQACRQGLALLKDQEDQPSERALLLTGLSVALIEIDEGDRTGEAEAAASEALAIYLESTGSDHILTVAARNNLGAVLGRKGRIAHSVAIAQENLVEAKRILGPEHPRMAYIHNQLASAYQLLGDSTECERHARRAVDLRQRQLPADSWLTAFSRLRLGSCLADLGRYRESLEVLRFGVFVMTLSEVEDDNKWLNKGKAELARVEERLN